MSDTKDTIIKVLNCFETGSSKTDYTSIFVYNDGPNDKKQVTLGRGFTECGGALWSVFHKYKENGGKNGDALLAYESASCKQVLHSDKRFIKLIHESCLEKEMIQAQDFIYDKIYYKKGLAWAKNNGFELPLSILIIQDSFLQSGGILDFLRARFKEKTPLNGGDEKAWMQKYVDVRHKWLANHIRKILNNTTYRTQFFKDQIKNSNWQLDQFPIMANGIKIFS